MNAQRAQEIAASPDMKNVLYEGTSIYIQHVDDETETARIFPLGQPDNEKTVPLNSLIEQ
jgi:small acid-soluble spore protein H (minor)